VILAGCWGVTAWSPALQPTDRPPADTGRNDYLKVHMRSGELFVLDRWSVPAPGENLQGFGTRYDVDRAPSGSGNHSIPTAEVALLETNRRDVVARFGFSGLVTYSALAGLTTLVCLADPKSCFGSCPTFYTVDDPDRPVAEGFSASFARSLEARDVDDLGLTAGPGPVSLFMRNEALETHAVRRVRLLLTPAHDGATTLQSPDGAFARVSRVVAPASCIAAGGNCLADVIAPDDSEYRPTTDSTDLAAREDVVVTFASVSGEVGVVLTARQSLVSTFVFYQSLAYAGSRAGDLLASLERGDAGVRERVLGPARELGSIQVAVSEDGGPWTPVGEFDEAGPIAADRLLIPIGFRTATDLRVRLTMARGAWRLDEVAVGHIAGPATPLFVEVDSVTTAAGTDALALERLTDRDRYLVTTPGDEYRLWFTIPGGGPHRVFLDAQGFYYEWMREPWLEEEDAAAVASLLLDPRDALRRMAPEFKRVEPTMEQLFWQSRFRRAP
jgi:hypothetical protein